MSNMYREHEMFVRIWAARGAKGWLFLQYARVKRQMQKLLHYSASVISSLDALFCAGHASQNAVLFQYWLGQAESNWL